MRPTTAVPNAAPRPGMASVVFLRPSSYGGVVVMTIIDDKGRFVGDSTASSCFATQMPPGKYTLIGWAENTAAVTAELAADKVYYVEVAPKMGVWSARVQLLALTPRSENWDEVGGWLAECERFTSDEPSGQAYLNGRKEDVQERIRRGLEILTEYTPEELSKRVLRPEDGSPGVGAPPATTPTTQPSPPVAAAAAAP